MKQPPLNVLLATANSLLFEEAAVSRPKGQIASATLMYFPG